MASLRDRVEHNDRAAFVGRATELAAFDDILGGDDPRSVVHLIGPAGIGKSTLLREVARRAENHGFAVRVLEGRDLPPFPDEIERALDLGGLDGKPLLMVIDSYELVGSLDGHLRNSVVPSLPDSSVVVLAGRTRPSPGWFDGGWDSVSVTIELAGVQHSEALQLVKHHGLLEQSAAEALVHRSGGSPLALVIGAQSGGSGSLADLLNRLLGEEDDPDRARVLGVAALARVTTPELLDAVLPGDDPGSAYKWLADRSYVEPLADGVALHSLVAQAMREQLRQRDPIGEARLRRKIADYLYDRAVAGQSSLSIDLGHLVVNQSARWGFSVDVGSRYYSDSVRDGDARIIAKILQSAGVGAWWEITEVFFTDHPECVGIVRTRDDRIAGYYIAISPADPPAAALTDPLLGKWLAYCQDVLATNSAVLWREAIDLTGELGEVTSMMGAAGVMRSGVINHRYSFLPIAPGIPQALAFSRSLGAKHVPELDVSVGNMRSECHVSDYGPQGFLSFQRDWIYRESGISPPQSTPVEQDPSHLIRTLRDPAALAHGPVWLGSVPSERIDRLRELVRDCLDVFGATPDDRLAHTIVTAAYLDDSAPHETIARRLHLSRSAYFRRLQAATARIADELAARRARRDF